MTSAVANDLPAEIYLVGFTDNRVDDQNLPDKGRVIKSDIGPAAVVMPHLDPTNALEAVSDTHDFLIKVSAQGTVLPVRFGTKLAKDDINAAASKHRELFDRFIGSCEVRIVAMYDQDDVLDLIAPDLSDDSSDLEKGERVAHLLAARRRQDERQFLEALASRAQDHAVTEAQDDWEAFRISLLAPMKDLDAIEGVLQTLAEGSLPHIRFKMTAPLPVYSFV